MNLSIKIKGVVCLHVHTFHQGKINKLFDHSLLVSDLQHHREERHFLL